MQKTKFTLEEIKEAFKKTFVHDSEVMGVTIVSKPEEGNWLEELFNDFKKNLN